MKYIILSSSLNNFSHFTYNENTFEACCTHGGWCQKMTFTGDGYCKGEYSKTNKYLFTDCTSYDEFENKEFHRLEELHSDRYKNNTI